MSKKSVITAAVGYMCLGLTGWMVSMPAAAWFHASVYGHAMGLMLPLAVILGVMGILTFLNENVLDSIVFFGGTGLLWSYHAYHHAAAMDPGGYAGWYYFVWAVFFAYVWLSSFKAGWTRMVFLLGLWLTLLAFAIGNWGGVHGFSILGGYLGLATSIVALIASAFAVNQRSSALASATGA